MTRVEIPHHFPYHISKIYVQLELVGLPLFVVGDIETI